MGHLDLSRGLGAPNGRPRFCLRIFNKGPCTQIIRSPDRGTELLGTAGGNRLGTTRYFAARFFKSSQIWLSSATLDGANSRYTQLLDTVSVSA